MKTLRLLTLTLLFTIGVGIPSCMVCECPPLEGNYFRPENAFLSNYRRLTEVQNEYLDEFDSVALENYRIALEFNYSYYGSISPSHAAPFSLMNSAYACTCQENGKLGSKEKIESINLLTVNDFNAEYQAGDTINELFGLLT